MSISGVWVITGSTGIAAATARLAARQGAEVFVIGKDAMANAALAGSICSEGGVCAAAEADLTSTAQAEGAVAAAVSRFGRVDALFNVAGISGRRYGDGPLDRCTEEGWDVTLDTNLKSVFRTSRAVLRQMLEQPPLGNGLRGTILNMSSVSAFSPEPRHFATHAYAASKAGIVGLTLAMAAYYAPHKIRVNVIAPGLVRTPMSLRAQNDAQVLEFIRDKQALAEGMLEPEDVARTAVFLLSDAARAVTGAVFPVDGGWRVR